MTFFNNAFPEEELTVANWIVKYLEFRGLSNNFSVTGGAAMHLNNAFGESKLIRTTYLHHEQSCSMAGEALARLTGRPSIVVVTAGPGAINAMNGVFGAFTDSIPLIIISGQARLDTLVSSLKIPGLRQGGDQELNTVDVVKSFTKFSTLLNDPLDLLLMLEKAWECVNAGRPGPVWLDVPINIQGMKIKIKDFRNSDDFNTLQNSKIPEISDEILNEIQIAMRNSKKPLILAGSGVAIENERNNLLLFAEKYNIPVATAWTHDLISSDHYLFAGRPGTIGTRSGNFILQSCDLLIVLGSRLNIRQTGFNFESFAKNAYKIWVDIDKAELEKNFLNMDLRIESSVSNFLKRFLTSSFEKTFDNKWLEWCKEIKNKFDPKPSDYFEEEGRINAYHLIPHIISNLDENDVIVCGDATACIVPFQTAFLKKGMRMFSNSGCASMGYDLPAAIGASQFENSRIICFAGDGSIMMNLQELQSMSHLQSNIILFILENDGYLSIKQTQRNYFGKQYGSDAESGLTFPDFELVAKSFGLKAFKLECNTWRTQVNEILQGQGPVVVVAPLALSQEFEPRIKSKMTTQGIVTPPLDDMFPHLDEALLASIRSSAQEL